VITQFAADAGGPFVHVTKVAPAKLAYERLSPLRDAPVRFELGQFVKCVDVGLDTIVQPKITVSADAGVAVAVTTTGGTSATAMANAVPVIRRRRPTITSTPDLRDARYYGWLCRSANGIQPPSLRRPMFVLIVPPVFKRRIEWYTRVLLSASGVRIST